ncbi:myoneurin-like isoform X8 [Dreissena polymorpha]|uniref:myoneurin-like isoform X8 n=1 Tax=Dreissena polymorpha TaxID=45954 RepID=UPI0022643E29|nr:myoneurin-like isoform X8 [Dreissena polymorpha]
MATGDLDVIKEVPGYKVILKAVVRSQIQQLIDQLAAYTNEESIILTASVADGTLSHIGSESGKSFLSDNEEVKSQFLGFCLKHHHLKQQKEKETARQAAEERIQREQQERLQQMMAAQAYQSPPSLLQGPTQLYGVPRQPAPRQPGYGQGQGRFSGARHEPYPIGRPVRKPRPVGTGQTPSQDQQVQQGGDENVGDVVNVKAEPGDDPCGTVSVSSQIANGNKGNDSVPCSPARKDSERLSSSHEDYDGVGDSDGAEASNLTGDDQGLKKSELDTSVTLKLEELTDTDLDLEITGVEPGRVPEQQGWDPGVSMAMNFDLPGAIGSPTEAMNKQGYKFQRANGDPSGPQTVVNVTSDRQCQVCRQVFSSPGNLKIHMSVHTGAKPYKCTVCHKAFRLRHHLNGHMVCHVNLNI